MKVYKFAIFALPGLNPISQKVKDFDVAKLKIPDGTSEFKFCTLIESEIKYNKKKVKLRSEPIYEKTTYWYGGTMLTVDQIENELFDPRSAQKFRDKKITHVVRGRFGGLMAAHKNDKIIAVRPPKGEKAVAVTSPIPAIVTADPSKV